MKVLAAHWQEEVLREVERTLPSDWIVCSATNGLDALLSARAEHFDLILGCLNLPVVSGIELARSVRSMSANQHTRIIFLSDGGESEGQRELIRKLDIDTLTVGQIGSVAIQK